jgi:hypothetical protein
MLLTHASDDERVTEDAVTDLSYATTTPPFTTYIICSNLSGAFFLFSVSFQHDCGEQAIEEC